VIVEKLRRNLQVSCVPESEKRAESGGKRKKKMSTDAFQEHTLE
jgi:hypothetical protein